MRIKFYTLQVNLISPVFIYDLFQFTVRPKISKKLHLRCILYRNFNSFDFRNWVAVGVVVVHAGLSAVSDWCDGEECEGNEWNAGA